MEGYKSKQNIHTDANRVEVFLSKIEAEYDSGVGDIDHYNTCLFLALLREKLNKRLSKLSDCYDQTAVTNWHKEVEKHFPHLI